MKRTRDLFKKIRDIKETYYVRMGTIKDRNCRNLTGAKEIEKRWEESEPPGKIPWRRKWQPAPVFLLGEF